MYILRGETVREATKIEVEDLLDAVGKGKYEQSPVADARKTDLDPHLLRRIGLSRDDRDALLQAGILVEDAWWHSQDKPTVAGLMCFGTADFHERHPGFGITVVHSDLGAAESRIHEYREGSQPRRLHRQHAPGHLLSQIQHTVGILVDWMPPFVDGYEVERLFTELVVNAVAHRSLSPTSLQDGGVEVRFFPDEVVIANPGALPLGSVTLIGRDSVRGRLCRNPKLMRLLKERGLALGQGVGLAYVKQVAPTFGRRLELAHVDGSFEARVRVDAELAARVLRSRGPVPVSDRMSPVERRGRIVDLLGEGPMSARELSETLGWPNSTVRAVLRDLLASGTIRRVHRASRSPKQKYRLVGLG